MHGIFPLMVYDHHKNLVATALLSPKAYQKSLEQGEIWAVHPDTLRVLPVEGTKGMIPDFTHDRAQTTLPEGRTWTGLAFNDLPQDAPAAAPEESSASPKEPGVLEALAGVIHRRNQDRPEGSYTTLLFQKGEDKIRKKTGEEAVELILARTDQEMVSEAADLVYHMLVLFEYRNLPLSKLMAELSARMK